MPLVRDGKGEIIVVDSGSTDRTVEIAQSYGAKVFIETWKGFAAQKNSAMDKASMDWVLQLDADEALEPELAAEMEVALQLIRRREASGFRARIFFLAVGSGMVAFILIPSCAWCDAAQADLKNMARIPRSKFPAPRASSLTHCCTTPIPRLRDYIDHMNSYSSMGAEVAVAQGRRALQLGGYRNSTRADFYLQLFHPAWFS